MSKSLLMFCFHCRLNGLVILILSIFSLYLGFPGGSVAKKKLSAVWEMQEMQVCEEGTGNSCPEVAQSCPLQHSHKIGIPRSGRSPGGGNGNPLQYSCLENSMDRGAWWATVHGVTKSWI